MSKYAYLYYKDPDNSSCNWHYSLTYYSL